ncbi:MAG: hypothetical protein K0Q76_4132 [Panacagrimonas sp.]|jgi:hypothetical protein|nr:hypothetical protein [Panacagrimonas sp.]MCC2659024.1 hypothetical protein [Panacagrimonas sp.]
MTLLRAFLVISTVIAFGTTIYAGLTTPQGFAWPLVFFGDLVAMDWRTQFNADFLIHLFLLATWIWWREGCNGRGLLFGFLAISQGGMFGFPYLIYISYKANGDPAAIVLGVNAGPATRS